MTIEKAKNVGPARIDIAYERLGDPRAPPVLLIMGLGAQLIGWPDGFCDEIVGQGLHVIRFDNRDVGESTHMTSAPAPNFMAAMAGDYSSVSYTLSDMAGGSVGLLDALGIDSAHLVGASMGGFIAQTIAIEHPRRVRSLTSIMSSTGDSQRRSAAPRGDANVRRRRRAIAREAVIERSLLRVSHPRLAGLPADLDAVADRAGRAFDRAYRSARRRAPRRRGHRVRRPDAGPARARRADARDSRRGR